MGYTLLVSLIEYKTLVMRGDLERASELLPSIPKEHHNRCVQSLQMMENGKFLLITFGYLDTPMFHLIGRNIVYCTSNC